MNKKGYYDAAKSFSEQLSRARRESPAEFGKESGGSVLKYVISGTLILGLSVAGALLLNNRDELSKKFKKGAA